MMKKSNIVHKNIQVINESRNETARNTAENLNANDWIFENIIANNNLLNLKVQNIYTTDELNTRRSNRLIKIENTLINIDRKANTTAFAEIDKILIKNKWNAVKVKKFEIYTNDCNSKNSLIAFLIFRNQIFTIKILSKQSILSMNYTKRKNNNVVAMI